MSLVTLAARRGAALARSRCPVPTVLLMGQRLASTVNHDVLIHEIDKGYLAWALDTVGMPASRLSALQDNPHIRAALNAVSPKTDRKSKVLEAGMHGPVTRMWNELSLEFAIDRKARGVGDLSSAIVCMSTGNRQALGAYLNGTLKLDYMFRTVPLSVLEDVVERARKLDDGSREPCMPPLSSILGPGGQKRPRDVSYKRLKNYLEEVKRYRVDLLTVHGFQVSKDQIVLASLNACGTWISPSRPVSDIYPWVAHMGLLYQAEDTRIPGLQYHGEQLEFPRWDVSFGERSRAVVPFWASHPPGRSTWAGFVLPQTPYSGDEAAMEHSFRNEVAQGFLKFSSQDVQSCSQEADLLQRLHTPKYVAGVVRPTFAYQDGDQNAITARGSTSRRVKHVLELGSIGKPLSQARSPRHLLYIMYDLMEVLRALSKKNSLHRDVSWYNTLIDPIHTVDDGRGVEPHRCISQVMFATRLDVTERPFGRRARTAGVTVFESCALLTDFDHSVDKSISDEAASREIIGTPMFISVERSRPSACRFNLPLDAVSLLAQLCEVENSDKGRKLFKAAFPAGDGDFMDWFKSMIDAEYVRRSQDLGSNPRINHDGRHEVRHDVESAWWTYLWAFARARPRASMLEAETSAEACSFDSFAGAMLNHAADGTSRDWDRAKYLFSAFNVESLFHPRLAVFERLFMALGSYLSIPWHLYSGMPEDHILTACQRLILATLVFDDVDLDVELDTEQPRITAVLDGSITLTGPAASTRSDIDNTRPAIIATRTAPFTRKTRKGQRAMSTPMPSFPHSSLPTVRRAHQPSLRMKRFVRSVAGRQRRKDKQASDYDVYMHDIHLDLRTPHALRLMVWKDKELWFGSGRRKTK